MSLDKFKNLCNLLAFEQADYYLDMIYHKIEVEKINIDAKSKFTFLRFYAYVAMHLDKTSDALMYCDGMRFIIEEDYDEIMEKAMEKASSALVLYQKLQRNSVQVYKNFTK